MRRPMLALLAAGAAALAIVGDTLEAGARPLGGGFGAGRAAVSRGAARIRGAHRVHRVHRRGYQHGFRRGPLVRATFGYPATRYLSEEAGFLSDSATFPTDSDAYAPWIYGSPAYPAPVIRYVPTTSYAVPVHRAPHASPRVVTVYRGAPNGTGKRVVIRSVRHLRP